MKKGITSLIDSIVEKNPYDYSLWENIFTVKSESEVFERALEFFPTSPIVWKRYIEYLQSQKSTDERVLLSIYQRCVQQCSCVMIWKLFVPFVEEKIHSLRERYQIYQLALDTIGSDPRSGFVWQRMYKLRLLVYNTLVSKNVPSLSGNTLLLNPFETSTIPIISEQVEECFALGDKIATIATLRHFFIQWLTTPVGNLETAFIAYSLFENSISTSSSTMIDIPSLVTVGGVGGLVTGTSTSESATKLVTKNLLQSGEKLVNVSKIVHKNLMVLVDSLHEDIPARPLDKSERREWMSKFVPWKRYILFEKSNPLRLDKPQYFNRVSYSYRNCLLYFSYHPEVWYEYFIFIWNCHPVQLTGIDMATELLNSAIQRFLPKDEILKLVLAEVYELRKKLDKVLHLYHSMVYIENPGDVAAAHFDGSAGVMVGPTAGDEGTSSTENVVNATSAPTNNVGNSVISTGKGTVSVPNNEQRSNVGFCRSGESIQENVSSFRRGGNVEALGGSRQGTSVDEGPCGGGGSGGGGDVFAGSDRMTVTADGGGGPSSSALSKHCSQMITSGLANKQYNPGVSAVVIIEYLNFILRSTNDKMVWREVFLDYVKRSPRVDDIKWICYSQALNEWRLYSNLEGAYRIFYFGMYYRHLFLDVSFMSCFVSFLLDTGRLQQARSTLQSAIYEIYKETGKVPKQLWLQWFHLERMSGSSIYSLNYLNRIYQLQKEGRNVEIDMLLSKRQQEAWHAVLGAPEFAELNKEFIGNDNIDPKTKVYGHSYIINPFDEDSVMGGGSGNSNNSNSGLLGVGSDLAVGTSGGGGGGDTTSNSLNPQNSRLLHSSGAAASGGGSSSALNPGATPRRSPVASGANRFILTCPSKFRTAFECFRFGSIYPNSSWTEFHISEGNGDEPRDSFFQAEEERGSGGGLSWHCSSCSKPSLRFGMPNVGVCGGASCGASPPPPPPLEDAHGKPSTDDMTSPPGVCDCPAAALGRLNMLAGEEKDHQQQPGGLAGDDDFESFLFERPFDFRLGARMSKKRTGGGEVEHGDKRGLSLDEEDGASCEDSDLESLQGLDDEELEEYYYYCLNSKTSDFTHVNEFKWSRVGRSFCSKPDTSSMVRFRFETYPIKNNSITGVSTQLQSQILRSTLTDLNSGDILKNIEEMQDFNSSMESTNKSFNTLLPKGIIDFVALLPPQNLPTRTVRNILGITQDVVDLLLTNLQTSTLPQKIDMYKYSPMTTSLANLSSTRNNSNHKDQDPNINNDLSNNPSRKSGGILGTGSNTTGTGNTTTINNGAGFTDNIPTFPNSNLDLNTLQEMVQKSIPWMNNNNKMMATTTAAAATTNNNNATTNNIGISNMMTTTTATNSFFTPCNVPNPNRFSNKPKDPNSKVQIQL